MNTITAIIEATGETAGTATFDNGTITANGLLAQAVAARRRTGADDPTIWKQLAGLSNGYVTFRTEPADQAAAVTVHHEFCRAPLHPGPCKGWKGTPAADAAEVAKAKTKLDRGIAMHGPDRTKWPKRQQQEAARLQKIIAGSTQPRTEPAPTVRLRALSDDQLAGRFAEISRRDQLDEPALRAVISEMDRREKGPKKPYKPTKAQRDLDQRIAAGDDYVTAAATIERRAGESLDQAVRRHHDEWIDLSYLQAEQVTRGHMLSPAGRAAGVDPRSLFTGPLARARAYASEELQRWWSDHPRLNRTQFRAQLLGRAADVKAAKATRAASTGKDFI